MGVCAAYMVFIFLQIKINNNSYLYMYYCVESRLFSRDFSRRLAEHVLPVVVEKLPPLSYVSVTPAHSRPQRVH